LSEWYYSSLVVEAVGNPRSRNRHLGHPAVNVLAVQVPAVQIFDLTDVPYMDSTGLGVIVHHYVRCQTRGVRLIVAGANPHVLELFKMTKVDALIPMTAAVEEADT